MTVVASILGLVLTYAIAFALTFGTARYGATATVVGLAGLVPLAVLQRIASGGGRVRPFGGFAGTLGLLAINAVALVVALAAGVPDLGRLDFALVEAGLLSVLWLHAVRRGHLFWGGLAGVGIGGVAAAFLAAWLQTGLSEPQAAAEAWWRAGWASLAAAGAASAVVGAIVRWASRRATAVGDLPSPASPVRLARG